MILPGAKRIGPAYILRGTDYQYDPLRGGQWIYTYDASLDGVNLLMRRALPYERVQVSVTDPPQYTVTLTSPDPAEAPVWELLANLKEIDIYTWGAARGVSVENCTAIQQWALKPTNASNPILTGDATQKDLANQLWTLVRYRTLKHTYEEIVLRYTVTITNAIQTRLAYQNSQRVFITAYLLTPAYSGLFIPAGIRASINAVETMTQGADIPPGFAWGWLKMMPTSRQQVIGKVTIAGEYWYGQWSTFAYKPPTIPGVTIPPLKAA